jgi:hypothetical protein
MKVLPQDRADYERLVMLVERMDPRDPAQAQAREHILSKLRRYQVDPAGRPQAQTMDGRPLTSAQIIARVRSDNLRAIQGF